MEIGTELLFPARAGVIPDQTSNPRHVPPFPRTRGGDPQGVTVEQAILRLFPARAGVIPTPSGSTYNPLPFPRTRGGDPAAR